MVRSPVCQIKKPPWLLQGTADNYSCVSLVSNKMFGGAEIRGKPGQKKKLAKQVITNLLKFGQIN